MKVAIYGQVLQENTVDFVLELLDELKKSDAEVAIEKVFYRLLQEKGQLDTYPVFTENLPTDIWNIPI